LWHNQPGVKHLSLAAMLGQILAGLDFLVAINPPSHPRVSDEEDFDDEND